MRKLMIINLLLSFSLFFLIRLSESDYLNINYNSFFFTTFLTILFKVNFLLIFVTLISDIYNVKKRHYNFPTIHIVLYPICFIVSLYSYICYCWDYSIMLGGFHAN